MKNIRTYQAGFGAVELVLAMAIMILVMGSIIAFQINIFSYNRHISGSLQTAQDAQVILKTMAKEIRTMVPSENGSYALMSIGTSSIVFFSDVDGDGKTERIRYYFSGPNMYRGLIEPTGNPVVYPINNEVIKGIVSNVRNNSTSTPVFQYYDENYNGSSAALSWPIDISQVRMVQISLTLDVDVRELPLAQVYSTFISLRNLKDNL